MLVIVIARPPSRDDASTRRGRRAVYSASAFCWPRYMPPCAARPRAARAAARTHTPSLHGKRPLEGEFARAKAAGRRTRGSGTTCSAPARRRRRRERRRRAVQGAARIAVDPRARDGRRRDVAGDDGRGRRGDGAGVGGAGDLFGAAPPSMRARDLGRSTEASSRCVTPAACTKAGIGRRHRAAAWRDKARAGNAGGGGGRWPERSPSRRGSDDPERRFKAPGSRRPWAGDSEELKGDVDDSKITRRSLSRRAPPRTRTTRGGGARRR